LFLIYWFDIVAGLPFSFYRQFYLEGRHGFNKFTKFRWAKEVVKIVGAPCIYWPIGIAMVMIVMYLLKDFFALYAASCLSLSFIIAAIGTIFVKFKLNIDKNLEMEDNSLRRDIS
jgi:hypothetical protein